MKNYLQDLKAILRPLWFVLLLQIFVLYTFIRVPQGIDVLYCVIEDFSTLFRIGQNQFLIKARILPFISILISVFYWSITSEFCSRLILYISDYSSQTLTPNRKRRRYYFSKYIPMLLFYFPTFVLIVAFVHSFFIKFDSRWNTDEKFNLLSLFIILLLLIFLLRLLYNVRYGKWKSKFRSPIVGYIDVMNLVGLSAVYDHYDKRTNVFSKKYKAVYIMYYRLLFIAMVSILFFIISPNNLLESIGATAFICMGFASWIVLLFLIEWITRKGILGMQLPFKTIFFTWLLMVSYLNNDHPIRLVKRNNSNAQYVDARPNLSDYLQIWIEHRKSLVDSDSIIHPIFIAAEGGALRTGCFSAMLLASLSDSIPEFKNRIFCYSTVSGGSIGVGLYNALLADATDSGSYSKKVRRFFEYDFLSPVTAKLVFGEPINWMSPYNFYCADRAVALEVGMENSWKNLKSGSPNAWRRGYQEFYSVHPELPFQLVNTTEVELGRRAIISPIKLDENIFYNTTDLLDLLNASDDFPYSTAMCLSARFPLISPAGFYKKRKHEGKHFVDGGYYENKGDITLLEVLKGLKQLNTPYKIKPLVIQLSFDAPDSSLVKGISFCNEFQEIVRAMYNTRIGRTQSSNKELQNYMKSNYGQNSYFEFYLKGNSNAVPMNWVLSNNALNEIENECKRMLNKEIISLLQRSSTQ